MPGTPASSVASHDLTMTVLGCGTMGIAILSGILAALEEINGPKQFQAPTSGASTPQKEAPLRLPSKFIACVECNDAAKRVKSELWNYSSSVKVTINENVAAVRNSDFILLSCKPFIVEEILTEKGMAEALDGKVIVSICAGVSTEQIEGYLAKGRESPAPEDDDLKCRVVRAMPNTSALIRESMTVISLPTPSLKPEQEALLTWVFKKIGEVSFLPPKQMDVVTALCGSAPAFCLLVLEAMADGAVAMGLPRVEAQKMAAQVMRGASSMVLNGEHPAVLRDNVCTPGGCTIGGLMVLEEGRVRGSMARAVREATCVASQLGQGVQGVNGTRFPSSQPPQ
ncbi:Pyrroline-5-carboxylate reductase [Zalerion maritima]|uniref:Pyrroline-5-carboxylate reductase n=1 Tax=Zalerion maritima TaxID=339359 RepID=A0AAD5RJG4_9PEZI|nr:Pyrroline-5-carboxylate reductase [Zalerion maritima]